MGCSYIPHVVRFKGRLVRVTVCDKGSRGHLNSAYVEKGKPLDLSEGSENWKKLTRLVLRDWRK